MSLCDLRRQNVHREAAERRMARERGRARLGRAEILMAEKRETCGMCVSGSVNNGWSFPFIKCLRCPALTGLMVAVRGFSALQKIPPPPARGGSLFVNSPKPIGSVWNSRPASTPFSPLLSSALPPRNEALSLMVGNVPIEKSRCS